MSWNTAHSRPQDGGARRLYNRHASGKERFPFGTLPRARRDRRRAPPVGRSGGKEGVKTGLFGPIERRSSSKPQRGGRKVPLPWQIAVAGRLQAAAVTAVALAEAVTGSLAGRKGRLTNSNSRQPGAGRRRSSAQPP